MKAKIMTQSGDQKLDKNALLELYRDLHEGKGDYLYKGQRESAHPNLWDGRCFETKVLPLFRRVVAKRKSFRVLDWGCGKALYYPRVLKEFAGRVQSWYLYDPGYRKYVEPYTGACDVLLCCDVMEHVLPEDEMETLVEMDWVLDPKGIAIFTICGKPDARDFVNGVNTHVNLKSFEEWKALLKLVFGDKKVILIYNSRQYWESWHATV